MLGAAIVFPCPKKFSYWKNMMKTLTCLGSACRIIRCGAIAVAMFAGFTLSGMQAAKADPFLDELVEFTGGVFYLEQKVPAVIIGVVRNGEMSVRGFGERAGKGSNSNSKSRVI